MSRTTLGRWSVGQKVNLERSLKVGDELGGHIVTGHVDALATIVKRTDSNEVSRFDLELHPILQASSPKKALWPWMGPRSPSMGSMVPALP